MPAPTLTLKHPPNYIQAGAYWPRAYWPRHTAFYWPLTGPRKRSVSGDVEARFTANDDVDARLTAEGDVEARFTASDDVEVL